MSDDVTFRDFAGALMGNDDAAADSVLQTLLGVDAATASQCTSFFKAQMQASPDFLMKAMSMRTAVESKDTSQVTSLCGECFGLDDEAAASAARHVLARYA